jgi:hypothetical protein
MRMSLLQQCQAKTWAKQADHLNTTKVANWKNLKEKEPFLENSGKRGMLTPMWASVLAPVIGIIVPEEFNLLYILLKLYVMFPFLHRNNNYYYCSSPFSLFSVLRQHALHLSLRKRLSTLRDSSVLSRTSPVLTPPSYNFCPYFWDFLEQSNHLGAFLRRTFISKKRKILNPAQCLKLWPPRITLYLLLIPHDLYVAWHSGRSLQNAWKFIDFLLWPPASIFTNLRLCRSRPMILT